MKILFWAIVIIALFIILKKYHIDTYIIIGCYILLDYISKLLLLSMLVVTLYMIYDTLNDD